MLLALMMSIAVQGVVVMNDGSPLPGVTVTLTQGSDEIVMITDANGRFSFSNVPDLPYAVRAELTGFTTRMVKASGDKSLELALKLQPNITEIVLD